MARPRQLSDEALLATARRCFLEHGPGVSTQVIARELGVSQPALFKRFATKDALLHAALAPARADWPRLVEEPPGEGDVREQLVAIALELSSFFERLVPA